MRVDVERLHGSLRGGVLPVDLIGVGRSEDAADDKSDLNSAPMSHNVMWVAFPHPSFRGGFTRRKDVRRGASSGSIKACG
ncbi:hypothetical protein FHT08_001656 [Xanthomonas campestris]|nr:hypothetical protein [Xanthomonas sp. CFBP 8151]